MKDFLRKLMLMLSFVAVVGIVGCDDDEDCPQCPTCEDEFENVLSDDITKDTTLAAGTYQVKGFINVLPGVTLTLEPGVKLVGKKGDRATIQTLRGEEGSIASGKINAIGTVDLPIVFTSAEPVGSRARGDIGGIVLNGLAKNNVTGGTRPGEGGAGSGGGNVDDDNSGILKYVRVEWGGTVISEGNEINGMTFNSVGDQTTLEYLQSHFIADDGFEWFGGTVNAKYLVSTGVDDDNFDMDNGYTGNVQFAVCVQDPNIGNSGFENSHSDDANNVQPYTAPTCYNVTLVGGSSDGKEDDGMLLKSNIAGTYKNMIIANFDDFAIFFKDDKSVNNYMGTGTGSLDLANIMVYCKGQTASNQLNDSTILDSQTKVGNSDLASVRAELASDTVFTTNPGWAYTFPADPFNGNVPDLVPTAAAVKDSAVAVPAGFDAATYLGAFDPSGTNWMTTWTQWNRD
jgi:hypothetical protein